MGDKIVVSPNITPEITKVIQYFLWVYSSSDPGYEFYEEMYCEIIKAAEVKSELFVP